MTAAQGSGGAVASEAERLTPADIRRYLDALRDLVGALPSEDGAQTVPVRLDLLMLLAEATLRAQQAAAARPTPAGEAADVERLRAENDRWREEGADRVNDLGRLLRALGLSDHARPIPPAEVFDLCLRDIEGLRQRIPDAEADALRLHREKMSWFDRTTAAEAALAQARAVLLKCEWAPNYGLDPNCPVCLAWKRNDHKRDCALAAELDTDTGRTVETHRDGLAPGVPVLTPTDGDRHG